MCLTALGTLKDEGDNKHSLFLASEDVELGYKCAVVSIHKAVICFIIQHFPLFTSDNKRQSKDGDLIYKQGNPCFGPEQAESVDRKFCNSDPENNNQSFYLSDA